MGSNHDLKTRMRARLISMTAASLVIGIALVTASCDGAPGMRMFAPGDLSRLGTGEGPAAIEPTAERVHVAWLGGVLSVEVLGDELRTRRVRCQYLRPDALALDAVGAWRHDTDVGLVRRGTLTRTREEFVVVVQGSMSDRVRDKATRGTVALWCGLVDGGGNPPVVTGIVSPTVVELADGVLR